MSRQDLVWGTFPAPLILPAKSGVLCASQNRGPTSLNILPRATPGSLILTCLRSEGRGYVLCLAHSRWTIDVNGGERDARVPAHDVRGDQTLFVWREGRAVPSRSLHAFSFQKVGWSEHEA